MRLEPLACGLPVCEAERSELLRRVVCGRAVVAVDGVVVFHHDFPDLFRGKRSSRVTEELALDGRPGGVDGLRVVGEGFFLRLSVGNHEVRVLVHKAGRVRLAYAADVFGCSSHSVVAVKPERVQLGGRQPYLLVRRARVHLHSVVVQGDSLLDGLDVLVALALFESFRHVLYVVESEELDAFGRVEKVVLVKANRVGILHGGIDHVLLTLRVTLFVGQRLRHIGDGSIRIADVAPRAAVGLRPRAHDVVPLVRPGCFFLHRLVHLLRFGVRDVVLRHVGEHLLVGGVGVARRVLVGKRLCLCGGLADGVVRLCRVRVCLHLLDGQRVADELTAAGLLVGEVAVVQVVVVLLVVVVAERLVARVVLVARRVLVLGGDGRAQVVGVVASRRRSRGLCAVLEHGPDGSVDVGAVVVLFVQLVEERLNVEVMGGLLFAAIGLRGVVVLDASEPQVRLVVRYVRVEVLDAQVVVVAVPVRVVLGDGREPPGPELVVNLGVGVLRFPFRRHEPASFPLLVLGRVLVGVLHVRLIPALRLGPVVLGQVGLSEILVHAAGVPLVVALEVLLQVLLGGQAELCELAVHVAVLVRLERGGAELAVPLRELVSVVEAVSICQFALVSVLNPVELLVVDGVLLAGRRRDGPHVVRRSLPRPSGLRLGGDLTRRLEKTACSLVGRRSRPSALPIHAGSKYVHLFTSLSATVPCLL